MGQGNIRVTQLGAKEPELSSSPATEQYMSSLGPEERRVAELLENVRKKLLSVSGNNRFLNFKNTAKSFHFPDVDLDHLYQKLVDEGKGLEILSSEQEEDRDNSPIHSNSHGLQLVVDSDSDVLEKRLRRVLSDSRLAIEETGLNILFLAFGCLDWSETPDGNLFTAPLILVPIKLSNLGVSRETGYYRFEVSYDGEDVEGNLCLREKMLQFGFDLPSFDSISNGNERNIKPSDYIEYIKRAISPKKNWTIRSDIILGFFQFSKLRMYEDLKPERWGGGSLSILHHDIIKDTLLGCAQSGDRVVTEDYDIDHDEEARALPLVVDADSSQHSALVDALTGKSMVIHGPPGTGKSQTITNLIAVAMARGKKVLFISEKLAALEVVYRNLEKIGLHHFCLQLHSKSANKKEVLDTLKQRLDLRVPLTKDIDYEIRHIERLKDQLYEYLEALSESIKPLGDTIYDILGKSLLYRTQVKVLPRIRISNVEKMSRDAFLQRCQALRDLSSHIGVYGKVHKGVWKGFLVGTFAVDLHERTEVTLKSLSGSLSIASTETGD